MSDIAIQVEHLNKMYKLYDKPIDRLKESLGLSKQKRYKEHYALRDVSLTVRRGETVGIIGTNGSGKSTILKIITGVLNPTGGKVEVNGRISALLIGFSREEIDQKLEDILNFADIGEFIYQPVKTYSSGMFVRLAFAVAINIEPEILIVDEALSVGDVFFQAKCYRKFEEFKKLGKTILFVSHDLGSISKYCDRVILLNKGVKLKEGEPKEIIDLYKKVLVNQFSENMDEDSNEAVTVQSMEKKKGENWKDYMLLNPEVQSYGDGRAEIEDFGVFDETGSITNTVYKMKAFAVRMRIRFQQTIHNPILAFSLKDLKGTELSGTNTVIEKVDTGTVKAGEIIEIQFSQIMRLQGGQYLLQLGCTGFENGDNFVVYHRLYDVCCIQVVADKTTVGYFDMDSSVEYKKGN